MLFFIEDYHLFGTYVNLGNTYWIGGGYGTESSPSWGSTSRSCGLFLVHVRNENTGLSWSSSRYPSSSHFYYYQSYPNYHRLDTNSPSGIFIFGGVREYSTSAISRLTTSQGIFHYTQDNDESFWGTGSRLTKNHKFHYLYILFFINYFY